MNCQTFGETFVCLWSDCKVFNKPSCSRSWLDRHVLSHGGNKPLQCIVQKCRQRFSSQVIIIFLYIYQYTQYNLSITYYNIEYELI